MSKGEKFGLHSASFMSRFLDLHFLKNILVRWLICILRIWANLKHQVISIWRPTANHGYCVKGHTDVEVWWPRWLQICHP